MSCERQAGQAVGSSRLGGIPKLAGKAAFYAGVGLAAAGATGTVVYRMMKSAEQAFNQKVSQVIAQVQRGVAIADSALAAETPTEARSGVLKEGVFALVEAWGEIKQLKGEDKDLKRQLTDFLADMLAATEAAETILEQPGDQVRLDTVRRVLQSSRVIFLLPRRNTSHHWRIVLFASAVTGLVATGVLALARRRRRQIQAGPPQHTTPSGENPQIAPPSPIETPARPDLQSPSFPLCHIEEINWRKRKLIGGGGLGIVYEVAPGVVAKVGDIEPAEAAAQRHFAGQGLALPVLDYQEEVELPQRVSREACPVHGKRKDFLPEGHICACGSPRAVLLMPKADDEMEGLSREEIQAFMLGFSRDCEQQLGRYWDARPANVARYQGRLVALDFGEEEMN